MMREPESWMRVALELGMRARDGLWMEFHHSDATLTSVLAHRADAGARY